MSEELDPVSVILNASLRLARMEAAGEELDESALALLDLCDELGAVRGVAAFEDGRPEPEYPGSSDLSPE